MKIICIGRNYKAHAQELKNPVPEEPVIFLKPDTSLLTRNKPFYLPEFSNEIHYEAELVVKISRNGKHIEEKFAHKYYNDITLGIDFTARDVQNKLKSKGLPWELSKSFDNSAVCGRFISLDKIEDINNIDFELSCNDEVLQKGNTSQMIFSIDKIISYVSRFISIKQGDLIYTGTPEGVGKADAGMRYSGTINKSFKVFDFEVR